MVVTEGFWLAIKGRTAIGKKEYLDVGEWREMLEGRNGDAGNLTGG